MDGSGTLACETGLHVIATDLLITGSVCYDNAEIVFQGGDNEHRTIEVGDSGALTITNSNLRNSNGDRLDYGLIVAGNGGLLLNNNDFNAVVVYSAHVEPESGSSTHLISNNFFTNAPYGVFTDRDRVVIEQNTFFKLNTGVFVNDIGDQASTFLEAMNPEVRDNTFEMNEVGIVAYTDQAGEGIEPLGDYHHNEIRANIIGVACYSAGWVNPDNPDDVRSPEFSNNNIYDNWGDAVNNLRGITIVVPGIGTVSVSDSDCDFDGNYIGSDSMFLSSNDEFVNEADDPVPNAAPALPYPLVVIDDDTTWDAGNPPPAITGPVIVASGATLTIEDITLASDFTIGSQLGGRLLMDNVVVNNANGIVVRNDDDAVKNSEFLGTQLFDPITLFRNNSTGIQDNTIVGSGRDRNIAIAFVAGQFTEEHQFTPGFSGNDISNVLKGHLSATMTVSIEDNHFHDIGLRELGFTLALLTTYGVAGIISTMNMDGNTFENVIIAATANVGTLASSNDKFDRGAMGYASGQLSTMTFTSAVFSNYNFAIFMILDKLTVATSNFTYNYVGIMGAAATGLAVSNSDFYNNFGAGVVPYTISIAQAAAPGGEAALPVAATCSNCWGPDDEIVKSPDLYGSSTTYTAAVASNGAPKPGWASSAQEAVGAGKTVSLNGGTLSGPVIARKGGEVKIENAAVDLNGFGVGAKGGGMAGNLATGKLTITGSTLTGGFLATNSTEANVKNNRFSDLRTGAYLVNAWGNGANFECNLVDTADVVAGIQIELLGGTKDMNIKRNLFRNTADMDTGFGFRGDRFHTGTVKWNYQQNTIVDGTSSIGGLFLFQNQTYAVTGNNFLGNAGNLAGQRSARNYTDPLPATNPTATDLRNNYYNAADGGLITYRNIALHSGSGLRFHHGPYVAGNAGLQQSAWPEPTWNPYATAKNEYAPCASFGISNLKPVENEDSVTFTDTSFGSTGGAITGSSWNFGDGNSGTGSSTTHVYASYGTKTVTLTTTSENGLSSTATRTLRVLARPVPSFGVSPGSPVETDTLVLTDTSTDPDGTISSRKWTFHDGTTSTASTVNKVYADGGTYSVTLEVTDNDGLKKTLASSVTVGHVAPVAGFTTSVGADGLTVSFTDASTHPKAGDAPPAGWLYDWDFAGLGGSSDRNPSFTFPSDSVFDITLTVTDNDGQSSSVTKSLDLRNVLPTAAFDYAPGIPVAGATTHFEDESTDPDGSIVAWLWSFGDGATSTEQDPEHVYADGGDYTVTLTVTDNKGGTATISEDVHVCETQVVSEGQVHIEVCGSVSLTGLLTLAQDTADELPAMVDGAVAQAEQLLADVQGQVPPLPPL